MHGQHMARCPALICQCLTMKAAGDTKKDEGRFDLEASDWIVVTNLGIWLVGSVGQTLLSPN